jgi:Arc/MetJ-type ribon-helix-helix transcriptional regulator
MNDCLLTSGTEGKNAHKPYVFKMFAVINEVTTLDEVITSRFSEELVRKVDQAVSRGNFKSRSEALRMIIEDHLKEHPELFLGDKIQELIKNAADLDDDDLEQIGFKLFKGRNVAELVAEGRS